MKKLASAFLVGLAILCGVAQAQQPQIFGGGGGVSAGSSITTPCSTANAVLYNASTPCSANLTWGAATGQGLVMAAGTATTDVAALSVTRTNNNSAVATGVKFAFTDTTSAAGFLPFQVLGGASGTTNLLSVSKAGKVTSGISAESAASPGFQMASWTSAGIASSNSNVAIVDNGGAFVVNWLPGRSLYASNMVFEWSSSTVGGSTDIGLSRVSAGVLGVGTGAAGSVAGQLHAGMLQASLGTALTLTAGAIGMSKMTASGSAPGASGLKLEVVCGTNAGTAKITALAGTSTTPVTVLDNIGSGVSGC